MTLHLELLPVLAVLAGVAILIKPRLLHYIVAGYLIAVGMIQIVNVRF